MESQNTFTKSNHQASADSDNPSWATLSAETTSGEEEALDLESQATTPDPVEEKQPSSHTTTHHSRASLATLFPYWQFTSILDSHSAPTIHKRPSNHLKRKPTSDSLSTYVSLAKKTKASPPPHLHVTHLGHHPLQPTNHPSPSYNSALPWGPTTAQAAPHLHLSTASQTQQHTHFSSHAMRTSLPSALTHQTLRLQKPLPPITNSSSIEDWTSVDDALRTQTASCHILHTSAQFTAPWEPEGAVLGRAGGVCIPLTQFANLEKESKGKARAVSGRTAPRWSNVGEFKSRLDAMYGPGDINRGLGRGPKNVSVIPLNTGIVGKGIAGGRWL